MIMISDREGGPARREAKGTREKVREKSEALGKARKGIRSPLEDVHDTKKKKSRHGI